jgi:hypothetical protein
MLRQWSQRSFAACRLGMAELPFLSGFRFCRAPGTSNLGPRPSDAAEVLFRPPARFVNWPCSRELPLVVYLDNVVLVQIPEPSGLGVGVWGWVLWLAAQLRRHGGVVFSGPP